jgi:lipid A 3-O-deacylase
MRIPLTLVLLSIGASALADDTAGYSCDKVGVLEQFPPVINFYLENDLFADQDQGYTSGVRISAVSPNLVDYTNDPCLPKAGRWLNKWLTRLHPGEHDQQNMVFTLGHAMYTPKDYLATELIEDDRPYAGWLYIGAAYNARIGDRLHTTELNLGIVGPSAKGEQAQDLIHSIRGFEKFRGWDNQLRDEFGIKLVHERKRRWPDRDPDYMANRWQWDAITHWGGSVGNIATHANAGAEIRFGYSLPDDFGTSPARPGGDNNAPDGSGQRWHSKMGAHVFLSGGGRLVLRDIFLDGNTFKDSHSVDKNWLVGEAAWGMAFHVGDLKFAFSRYFRTREFERQSARPSYGSFTVSGAF